MQKRTTPVVKYSRIPFAGDNLTVLYLREIRNQISLGPVINCSSLKRANEFSEL